MEKDNFAGKPAVKVRSKKKTSLDEDALETLYCIPTEDLLTELTHRYGVYELGLAPYWGSFVITHLYHSDPESILDSERVILINTKYR